MAYVYVFENVVDSFEIQDYQIVNNVPVVSMVKDKSGKWHIYRIGAKLEEYEESSDIIKPIKDYIRILKKGK